MVIPFLNMLVALASITVLLLTVDPARAEDACEVPEVGSWWNEHARNKQVRRVEVESVCENERPVIRMRVFTRCAPRDCKWGWQPAYRTRSGRLAARFPGFFGARSIEVIFMGKRIEVLVTINPHDPRQTDDFHSAILTRR